MNRLNIHFQYVVCYDNLFKDHFINVMQTPKLHKIVLNTGVGRHTVIDRKRIIPALLALELISGQKAVVTRAKKSVDKFKLREKMPIGCKVSLRCALRAHGFFDRLLNLVLSQDGSPASFGHPGEASKFSVRENKHAKGKNLFTPNPEKEVRASSGMTIQTSFSSSFGIKTLAMFREIRYEKFDISYGVDVTFVIDQANAWQLSKPQYFLSAFQMPFSHL